MINFIVRTITYAIAIAAGYWWGVHSLHLVANPFASDDIATYCAAPAKCIAWSHI